MNECFLYCRTSTTDQITSIKAQENFKSEEYNIVDVFSDFGKTATKVRNRPQFVELLKRCGVKFVNIENKLVFLPNGDEPEVRLILVSHTSRFMRNARLMEDVLDTLKEIGVEIRFLDMNKSSFDIDFKFTLSILFLLDEQESRNTSQKVRAGLEKARKQKKYLHPGYKILGFDYDSENNRFIKNEDSGLIYNIFNEYKAGASIRVLANKYDKTLSRVKDIIDNPRYSGYDRYKKKDSDEVEMFKSERIEPIITLELWEECQKIKSSRRCGKRGINNSTYNLSSKLICSKCGTKFFHKQTNKKPNSDLWKCRKAHNEPHICNMGSISEKTIIEYLKSSFGLKAIRYTLKFRIEVAIYDIDIANKKELIDKINPLIEQKGRLKRLYILGEIEEEEYFRDKEKFSNKLEKYQNKLEKIKEKEHLIKELEKLHLKYESILDEYDRLLEENPQELFKRISYIKIGSMVNVLTLKERTQIEEVMFTEFEPIKEYYGQFINLEEFE